MKNLDIALITCVLLVVGLVCGGVGYNLGAGSQTTDSSPSPTYITATISGSKTNIEAIFGEVGAMANGCYLSFYAENGFPYCSVDGHAGVCLSGLYSFTSIIENDQDHFLEVKVKGLYYGGSLWEVFVEVSLIDNWMIETKTLEVVAKGDK